MDKLTDDQRKLVEENQRIAGYVVKKMKLPYEDYMDLALLFLCQAALKYDPSKSAFSSYAYQTIYNNLIWYITRSKKDAHVTSVSLYTPITAKNAKESSMLIDVVPAENQSEQKQMELQELRMSAKEKMNLLSPHLQKVFSMLCDGLTYDQIAAKLGTSRHVVITYGSQIKKRLKFP